MALRVIGKACPISIYNVFQEMFLPGALDDFLKSKEAKNLPMRVKHRHQIGVWENLCMASDNWLYCSGTMDDRETECAVKSGRLAELSISYSNTDQMERCKGINLREVSQEKFFKLAGGLRIARMLDAAAKKFETMDAAQAFAVMSVIKTATPDECEAILASIVQHETLAAESVHRAELSEISVVDHGAFKNTSFHWQQL